MYSLHAEYASGSTSSTQNTTCEFVIPGPFGPHPSIPSIDPGKKNQFDRYTMCILSWLSGTSIS